MSHNERALLPLFCHFISRWGTSLFSSSKEAKHLRRWNSSVFFVDIIPKTLWFFRAIITIDVAHIGANIMWLFGDINIWVEERKLYKAPVLSLVFWSSKLKTHLNWWSTFSKKRWTGPVSMLTLAPWAAWHCIFPRWQGKRKACQDPVAQAWARLEILATLLCSIMDSRAEKIFLLIQISHRLSLNFFVQVENRWDYQSRMTLNKA